jgi:hypothetical protein
MQSKAPRGRKVQDAIRAVLLREWDPIGVANDDDWPQDEYDAYVGEIYGSDSWRAAKVKNSLLGTYALSKRSSWVWVE